MRSKKGKTEYKIIITVDRRDYDNLSELMNNPELGKRIGTFYFNKPDELELILKAFEGLFYQMLIFETFDKMGGEVMDYMVFEDWWHDECCKVCELCFLRIKDGNYYYECMKKQNNSQNE